MRGPKPKDRFGESNIMKNGMRATISRYKSSAEIDVQFEDGVIVKNKTYASFRSGMIGHPNTLHKAKIKDRTGEVQQMSNGMTATIIRYTNGTDIDIEFEDGSIRTNCTYKEFLSGYIAHPNSTREALASNRLGEKRIMNCGLIATITKYNAYQDIEITFEDGEIIYPVDYGQFTKCSISHPRYDNNQSLQEACVAFYLKELGFKKMKRGSLKDLGFRNLELDLYNPELALAIEIDGHFHKDETTRIRDIDKNLKCHQAGITLYRLREKDLPILNDSFSCNYILDGEILYNGLIDCSNIIKEILDTNDIKLPFDDFIDCKRDLNLILDFHFCSSQNYSSKSKIGEKQFHKPTSQFMEIIRYKDYDHIDVQFEDGAIVCNKNYGAFKRGEIKHPKYSSDSLRCNRLSESKVMNCGIKATIIAYRNAEDMDIEFEDGSIRTNVTYFNFQQGNIKNKSQ